MQRRAGGYTGQKPVEGRATKQEESFMDIVEEDTLV